MSNLISEWFTVIDEVYGSRDKAIKHLNKECGMAIRQSELTDYKNLKRKPSICMELIMKEDIWLDVLKEAGFRHPSRKLTGRKLKQLIKKLTLPQELDRKKNGERRR